MKYLEYVSKKVLYLMLQFQNYFFHPEVYSNKYIEIDRISEANYNSFML